MKGVFANTFGAAFGTQQGTLLNFVPEYKAIYNAFNKKPNAINSIKQNTFVKTLVDAGIWPKAECLVVMANNEPTNAIVHWNNPAKKASIVNAPVFDKYKGFGGVAASTSYLNLNFIPRTDKVNLSRTSLSFGFWSPDIHANSKRIMGVNSGGALLYFTSSATEALIRNLNETGDYVSPLTHHGFLLYNRSAADATQFYYNGIKKSDGVTVASANLPDRSVFALAENLNGNPNAITDGYLSVIWIGTSLTEGEALILSNAVRDLIEGYFVKKTATVIPDTINSTPQACTGMAINTSLSELYIVSAVEEKIYVYDYNLNFKRYIVKPTGVRITQGLTWDSTRNLFYSWVNDTIPKLFVFTESELIASYDFGYGTPGSLCYNETDDCLYSFAAGGLAIKKHTYNSETSQWTFDSDISVISGDEGLAYDSDTDTLWINKQNGFIANLQKDGTVIKNYKQPLAMNIQNEGMVYCPSRKTIYVNADTYFHGEVPGGNRAWELDFNVYK